MFAHSRPQGRAQVELMTIHAAKGLEFDAVIVPGLHRAVRGENRELLRWTRIAGADGGIVLAPIRAEGAEPDSIYRWIELLEQQRLLRERARLLYVAMTRAKRALHLVGAVKANERDGAITLSEPPKGSMLRMIWRAVAPAFEVAAPAETLPSGPSAPPREQVLRRLPLDWAPPDAPPGLTAPQESFVDIEAERPDFDWVSQVSRRIGTLVHRELDRMTRPRAESQTPASLQASRSRLIAELAELGVPPDRCTEACDKVVRAIEHTLSDARGRWLLGLEAGVREAESELSLAA